MESGSRSGMDTALGRKTENEGREMSAETILLYGGIAAAAAGVIVLILSIILQKEKALSVGIMMIGATALVLSLVMNGTLFGEKRTAEDGILAENAGSAVSETAGTTEQSAETEQTDALTEQSEESTTGADPADTEGPVSDSTATTEEDTGSADSQIEEADKELEAVGSAKVDKGLFSVTMTIPADYVDTLGITEDSLKKAKEDEGIREAKFNEDGSVTYVMTKKKHQEMMDGIKESIDSSLQDMVGSEDYPNITAVDHNDDYTVFTVTTKSTDLSLSESFMVMALYMDGGLYNIYAGTPVDNVHVDFVNADTGKIINQADSKDLGSDDTESTDETTAEGEQ